MWGIGLRPAYYSALEHLSRAPALEIMSDNLLGHKGGPGLWHTDRLAERGPVLLHGVGLNIGSSDPLDTQYLCDLRQLIARYKPLVVSDHLALTRAGGLSSYELLPVARTTANLGAIASRISAVQESLGCQLSLENTSAYVAYRDDSWSEGAFLAELSRRSGCGVLLDINNLYVNAFNFKRDVVGDLADVPMAAVTQLHIAGHTDCGDYLFDTHDQPAADSVIDLMQQCLGRLKADVPVILEWDQPNDDLNVVLAELKRLQTRCLQTVQDQA